jgi:N,N'-diacetyllegionaminate synthase
VTAPGSAGASLRQVLVPDRADATGCLVVVEVGQAHDGSLGTAHALLDAAADAGADAIKFQTHLADAESTPAEPWRVAFSPQDGSRLDYWRRMELSEQHWSGLREHAHERHLGFLSSPFSVEAVELLQRVGIDAWKVASGELGNHPLLDAIAACGQPVLLSTGMSPWSEVEDAVARLGRHGAEVTVLQCTSEYPCPPERLGLNVLAELRERFDGPVGLSDHTGSAHAIVAAAALGAEVVEVHVTLSPWAFGPDVSSSLKVEDLAEAIRGVHFVNEALAHPVDKDAMADELAELRTTFGRSVVTRHALPAGTVLTEEHLAAKKPAGGLPASALAALVGRSLAHDVARDHRLGEDDLEP